MQEQSTKIERRKTLEEIIVSVHASLSVARAVVGKEEKFGQTIDQVETAWSKIFSDFIGMSLAIDRLRLQSPEEIASALNKWQDRLNEHGDRE